MKNQGNPIVSTSKSILALLAGISLGIASLPATASGKNGGGSGGGSGGGGGGGSTATFTARVTGYVTAIDYVSRTITIGASYYGSGALKVDDNTQISLNNVSCSFEELTLGDWIEARYDYTTRIATKLSGSGS